MAVFLLFGHNSSWNFMLMMLFTLRQTPLVLPAICCVLISSCQAMDQIHLLPTLENHLEPGNKVIVRIPEGEIEVLGHEEATLVISGSSNHPDSRLEINEVEDEILVEAITVSPRATVSVQITAPHDTTIEIDQMSGFAHLHDFQGTITFKSISADISAQRLNGVIRLTSRRGSIGVTQSSGEIHAIAEADDIAFYQSSGTQFGTSIMGDIRLQGEIGKDDRVMLETDHGSIYLDLSQESQVRVDLESAGGLIICSFPGLTGTHDDCSGKVGEGSGELRVRTVSGSIRFNRLP